MGLCAKSPLALLAETGQRGLAFFRGLKANTPARELSWGVLWESLAMTYFHTGIRTIIGAESFHGPVRDGKGWYRLAMVTRL